MNPCPGGVDPGFIRPVPFQEAYRNRLGNATFSHAGGSWEDDCDFSALAAKYLGM